MAKRKVSRPSLVRSAEPLYQEIRAVLESARAGAYRAVNVAMVQAYWNEDLSRRLTAEYGRGFDVTNLRKMRQFCRTWSQFATRSVMN